MLKFDSYPSNSGDTILNSSNNILLANRRCSRSALKRKLNANVNANVELQRYKKLYTQTGRPFGLETFVDQLEFRLNPVLKPKKPGRPKKKTGECP